MGRTPKPWYRSTRQEWRVEVGGVQYLLHKGGPDEREQAEEAYHQLRVDLTAAKKAAAVAASAPPVVGEVVVRYLDSLATRLEDGELSQSHYVGQVRVGKSFALAYGDRQLSTITADDIQSWLAKGGNRGPWNATSRYYAIHTLRAIWKFARKLKFDPGDPFDALYTPTPGRREEIPTLEQLELLIQAIAHESAREILRFIVAVGCRPGEAYTLAAKEIDWARDVFVKPGKTTKKTQKLRVVYIPPEWMPRLRELAKLHPEGELFRAPCGGPWTISLLGYHVRKARRGKGWPWATVYGLRHLFATEALRRGVPVAHVSELLGHVDTKQVMKSYSHLARHDVELHASLARVQGKPKKRKR